MFKIVEAGTEVGLGDRSWVVTDGTAVTLDGVIYMTQATYDLLDKEGLLK